MIPGGVMNVLIVILIVVGYLFVPPAVFNTIFPKAFVGFDRYFQAGAVWMLINMAIAVPGLAIAVHWQG